MTWPRASNRIERKLNKLDGVDASVNYATEQAAVRRDPRRDGRLSDLVSAAVEAAGYRAALASEAQKVHDRPTPHAVLGQAPSSRRRSPRRCRARRWSPPLQFAGWEWLALALATPVVLLAPALGFHRAALLKRAPSARRRWTR